MVTLGVVGGHVERPPVKVDREARGSRPDDERGDPGRRHPALSPRFSADHVVGCPVHPGVEALRTVQDPVAAVADRRGLQPRRVTAVSGFGEPKPIASYGRARPGELVFLCAAVPCSISMCTNREVSDTDASFWRSLCRPRPLCARCSRSPPCRGWCRRKPPASWGSRSEASRRHLHAVRISRASSPIRAGVCRRVESRAPPLPPVVEEPFVVSCAWSGSISSRSMKSSRSARAAGADRLEAPKSTSPPERSFDLPADGSFVRAVTVVLKRG